MSALNVWSIIKIMTGPYNFIDKNPENEENQFKNLSHDKCKVTNTSCRLIFDLIGSISREYQVMNESNNVDFLLRLKSMSVFWGQPDRGLGVLCWEFIVYLGFQAFALGSANFQLALNTVRSVSARI